MSDQMSPQKNWEQNTLEKLLFATLKEQRSSRRWGIFFKIVIFGYLLLAVVPFVPKLMSEKEMHEAHVALIDVNGAISEGKSAGADYVVTSLRQAFDHDKVTGVILRINSPGGSPVQAGYIYDEIMRLRAKRPELKVYAVITDIGASAAYYIAAACNEIYADKASFVGSIGAMFPAFGAVEAMKKVGVENRAIVSGENKLFLDPFSPANPEQTKFAQSLVDIVHRQFIDSVKKGRGDRIKSDTPGIFSGLVWTGEQALTLGLVDGLGSAGHVARDVIGNDNVVDYTVSQSFFDKFTTGVGTVVADQIVQTVMQPNLTVR